MSKHAAAAVTVALGLLVAAPAMGAPNYRPIRKAGNFGGGVGSGTLANGLSGKLFLSDSLSLQANVGSWGAYQNRPFANVLDVAVSADLLFEMPPFYDHKVFEIGWAIGPGVGVGLDDDYVTVAAAGVFQVQFNLKAFPLDVVAEVRPYVHLRDHGYGYVHPFYGTGAVRFWFL